MNATKPVLDIIVMCLQHDKDERPTISQLKSLWSERMKEMVDYFVL